MTYHQSKLRLLVPGVLLVQVEQLELHGLGCRRIIKKAYLIQIALEVVVHGLMQVERG